MNSTDIDENLTVLEILEKDRHRIANDLHDTSLQNLTYLVHKIELAGMMVDQDPMKAKLELAVINKKLRATINDIRDIIFGLHPMTFDDLGLKASFERLIAVFNENMQYEIDARIDEITCENKFLLINVFRTVQECFTNIRKHSNADKIIFRCYREKDDCIVYIEDNGVGYDASFAEGRDNPHFGISLMKERVQFINGEMSIKSEIGKGTRITLKVPLV